MAALRAHWLIGGGDGGLGGIVCVFVNIRDPRPAYSQLTPNFPHSADSDFCPLPIFMSCWNTYCWFFPQRL